MSCFDVVAAVRSALAGALGVPCYCEVPEGRPQRFTSVERTGGATYLYKDEPNLAVQLWAESDADAYALAMAARAALLDLWQLSPQVCRVVVGGTYRFPDPDSRAARYQIDVYLVTRL